MAAKVDDNPRSMREIVQKRFSEEVIGSAAALGSGWLVLVMDDQATRVISSALTMYDIMEQRVTLVEKLARQRQPFREMEVVYIVAPSQDSIEKILADFPSEAKAKYGAVHLFFLETIGNDVLHSIQSNGTLCSRIKSFKEINMNFVSAESNAFHLDMPDTLSRFHGNAPDSTCPRVIARKLATLAITLNEYPTIRYQNGSRHATEIARTLHDILTQFKSGNPAFWCHGEDAHQERDRGQFMILDRTFDPLSPLMHEYTYQAMVNDLLPMEDDVFTYKVNTQQGAQEKKALLSENDEYWVELKYQHIARVIEIIKEKLNDIIQNNSGAQLQKNSGADMNITDMAAAVKKLPEYQAATSKLNQHVTIAQGCMDNLISNELMEVATLEQTMSTGVDEEAREVRGAKLVQLLLPVLTKPTTSKLIQIRLLAIYILTQRDGRPEERQQLMEAARLDSNQNQILVNFIELGKALQSLQQSSTSAGGKTSGGIMSMFRGKTQPKHQTSATAEGEYADTRHLCRVRILLDQLISGELPNDQFPSFGPQTGGAGGGESKIAKSARKYGTNSRWGRKDQTMYSGGRFVVFIAGGVSYSEMRAGSELMTQHTKEVVVGGSHIINPTSYLDSVAKMHPNSMSAIAELVRR